MEDQYARSLLRIVCAQLLGLLSFDSVQRNALDVLTDVLELYIKEVGHRAHSLAAHACRNQCNVFDVRQVIEDMGVDFSELEQFESSTDQMEFAMSVPRFPFRSDKSFPLVITEPKDPPPPHIPSFFVPLPDKRTYVSTPIFSERITKPGVLYLRKSKQLREMQDSLIRLLPNKSASSGPEFRTRRDIKDTPAPTHVLPNENVTLPYASDEDEPRLPSASSVSLSTSSRIDDRIRKRARCEQILSLSHSTGMDEAPPEKEIISRSVSDFSI